MKDEVDFGFDRDLEEIEAKYAKERDRRVRGDYDHQYIQVDFDKRPASRRPTPGSRPIYWCTG